MARGKTLRQLVSDLRDELRRANSPTAGPDDIASLRRTINHNYNILWMGNDWPFLRRRFPAITLNAGQRYYDFPSGLDPERITDVKVKWSADFMPVERGITVQDYTLFDSESDERSAPMMKWDIQFTGTREQIEVWPIPDATAQSLRFDGVQSRDELVDDDDICYLESEIVVLYSAAELLPKDSPSKDAKLALAKELLRLARVRGNSAGGREFRLGLEGEGSNRPHFRSNVRVSG